ncbi:TIGR04141 family sporadically distributed protein [Pseudomonas paralcaligenes]|uniref:TIGR04141 family sporadically distributed protein n=1 Tax=Pseudomonas paralcaligenes TaxID=2772558 RepID=UPI001C816B23|nr:TIGR04141 family sporadically distributed protein [Pseudomonas paralcaligenes]
MAVKKKERKERLSIYLAKDPAGLDSSVLKIESAKPPVVLDIDGVEGATLYVKQEPPKHSPPWTKLFTTRPEVDEGIFGDSSTVGAALTVRHGGAKFILTFGSGFHLLHNENIERDFGLRVTLNSVDPEKLRSLDKASYDHNPLNSRTQSAREVDIFDLHIDSETEMLYAVTGASMVDVFGAQVTGRDALTLIVSMELDGLPAILKEALSRYKKKLPDNFEWVDNVSRVRDSVMAQILDLELDDVLKAQDFSRLWLGEPEVVDWETQIGYSFDMWPRTPRHVVLDIDDLCDYLMEKNSVLNCESLRATSVHINNGEYKDVKCWSAYRCLYAEVSVGGEEYILRNGVWYRVDANFVGRVDSFLSDLKVYEHQLPIYSHDTEGEYNAAACVADPSYHLMDKRNIKIGGVYDKIEFCDLIKDWKDLIHVKYYRSSSTLSHLFAQGCVSAEVFVRDQEFREKVNGKLPAGFKLADAKAMPDARAYQVVYAVATDKKLPEDLPFFSKVTLKNSLRTLRSLGYSVKIAKIDVDPLIRAKKKIKPKVK